uniref:Protein naked cuticle homolog n=1 Tax=Romanomermis culicivorax TaxID=13658 RepID=A0A915JWX4_ROMCU
MYVGLSKPIVVQRAFGHFRPCPDDKVRLLSVLSHKMDDNREDDENFGSEDGDQNPDDLSILSDDIIDREDQENSSSSSVSTSSLKNMAPDENNRLIDLKANREMLNNIKAVSIQNDLKISDRLVCGEQRKNDDLFRRRQATNIRRVIDPNRSIEIDKKKCNDEELKSAQEWIFTLYDFDAKGRVTKGDIVSLVRSIYDVLTNAEIPILKSSSNEKPPARQPMGAFRVKLAIISKDNQVTDRKDVNLNVNKRNTLEEAESSTSSPSPVAEKCRRWTTDRTEIYEQMPLIGGKAKKQNIRHTLQDQKENFEPVSLRKTSKIHSTTRPKSYIHRDYVNLSELEACCHKNHSPKNPPHFWTPCLDQNNRNENVQCKNEIATADAVVHHIRHCDQHCHCPVDKKRSILSEKALLCHHGMNTHFEEKYLPHLFAKHSNRHTSQLQSKIRAYYDRTHSLAPLRDADRHRRAPVSNAAATCESPCRPGPDYCRRQRTTPNTGEDVDCGLDFYHCVGGDDAKLREKPRLLKAESQFCYLQAFAYPIDEQAIVDPALLILVSYSVPFVPSPSWAVPHRRPFQGSKAPLCLYKDWPKTICTEKHFKKQTKYHDIKNYKSFEGSWREQFGCTAQYLVCWVQKSHAVSAHSIPQNRQHKAPKQQSLIEQNNAESCSESTSCDNNGCKTVRNCDYNKGSSSSSSSSSSGKNSHTKTTHCTNGNCTICENGKCRTEIQKGDDCVDHFKINEV